MIYSYSDCLDLVHQNIKSSNLIGSHEVLDFPVVYLRRSVKVPHKNDKITYIIYIQVRCGAEELDILMVTSNSYSNLNIQPASLLLLKYYNYQLLISPLEMSLITETLSVNYCSPFRHFRFVFSLLFYTKAYARYIKDVLML